jgi:hypothetical protein
MIAVPFCQLPFLRDDLVPFLDDIQADCRSDNEIDEAEVGKQNSQAGENDGEVGYHVHSRENPGGTQMHALIAVLA